MSALSKLFLVSSACTLAIPAVAQETTTTTTTMTAPAADPEVPATQSLNNTVADSTSQAQAINEANQHQYALDRAAYRAAIASKNAKADLDSEIYARKEQAYADAMQAWRTQNDECKRGILKSCKKPTPVPADFY